MGSCQIIVVPTATIKISPLGFLRYAAQFYDAAKAVEIGASFNPVPYYIYCRSLELVLKAFMLAKNVPISQLKDSRRLGHDRTKVLNKAKGLGLEDIVKITGVQENEIRKANAYYNVKHKGFEYFKTKTAAKGYKDLPEDGILSELISDLITDLESLCLNAE